MASKMMPYMKLNGWTDLGGMGREALAVDLVNRPPPSHTHVLTCSIKKLFLSTEEKLPFNCKLPKALASNERKSETQNAWNVNERSRMKFNFTYSLYPWV